MDKKVLRMDRQMDWQRKDIPLTTSSFQGEGGLKIPKI